MSKSIKITENTTKCCMKTMYKQGFSLVSILIALLVIGFGFSLIIPHLTKYATQSSKGSKKPTPMQQSFNVQIQKTTSDLKTAYMMVKSHNGGTIKGVCDSNECVRKLFQKQLSISRTCNSSNFSQCWHSNSQGFAGLVLSNGTLVKFYDTDKDCNNNICGKIEVDVNGFRPPNKKGQDIYSLNISPTQIN